MSILRTGLGNLTGIYNSLRFVDFELGPLDEVGKISLEERKLRLARRIGCDLRQLRRQQMIGERTEEVKSVRIEWLALYSSPEYFRLRINRMSSQEFPDQCESSVPLLSKSQLLSDLRHFISQLFETCLASSSREPI